MRATRNDSVGGLRGAMQRAELLDFLLRLAKSFVQSAFGAKESLSDHMDTFVA